MKTINVTVYSDYVCPYCYIGAARVQQLQQEYNSPVVWKSFELHPEAPVGRIPPSMFYQNNPNLKRISDNANSWRQVQICNSATMSSILILD